MNGIPNHDMSRKTDPDYHFGACPICGREGTVDVGRVHYGVCKLHNVFWPVGENLFSRWREQTPKGRKQAVALLTRCTEVTPIFWAVEIHATRKAEPPPPTRVASVETDIPF